LPLAVVAIGVEPQLAGGVKLVLVAGAVGVLPNPPPPKLLGDGDVVAPKPPPVAPKPPVGAEPNAVAPLENPVVGAVVLPLLKPPVVGVDVGLAAVPASFSCVRPNALIPNTAPMAM